MGREPTPLAVLKATLTEVTGKLVAAFRARAIEFILVLAIVGTLGALNLPRYFGYKRQRDDLKARLETVEAEKARLAEDMGARLATIETDKTKFEEELHRLIEELTQTKEALDTAKQEREVLARFFAGARLSGVGSVKGEFKETEKGHLSEKERFFTSMGQLVLWDPGNNFVVLNIGERTGVFPGAEFEVVRGDEVLGRVQVTRSSEELSAAILVLGSDKDKIRIGDKVGHVAAFGEAQASPLQ